MGEEKKESIWLSTIKNPEVKKIMTEFFEEVDRLYDDMDNLSFKEYKSREKAMWAIRGRAMDIDGDIFLVSLWAFEAKAEKLFGQQFKDAYGKLWND